MPSTVNTSVTTTSTAGTRPTQRSRALTGGVRTLLAGRQVEILRGTASLAGPNRIAVALVILGGLMGSAIIGVFATGGPHAAGIHLLALIGFLLSGVFGVWLVWGILRHGRL